MNWKLNDVKKLTNEKWLNLYEADYTCDNGNVKWTFASRRNEKDLKCKHKIDKCDAVCVIPKFKKDGEEYLIFCKEFRLPINDFVYSFPAGLVEDDEEILESAIREVKEEIGASIINIKPLTDLAYNTEGMSDENIMIYICDVKTLGKQDLKDNEDIKVEICKVRDLKAFMKGKIFSAKASIFCSLYYKIYNQKLNEKIKYKFIRNINSYVSGNLKNKSLDEFWVKKIVPVKARVGKVGEEIITYTIDGMLETKNVVKLNPITNEPDFVVTNSLGEEYVVDSQIFHVKYESGNKKGLYVPKSNPIRAVRINENIQFLSSFNQLFKVKKDDYLIIPYNRKIYGITKESLYENYTFVKD